MIVYGHLTLSILASFLIIAFAAPSCLPLPTIQFGLGNCTILAPNQTDVNSWGILIGVEGSDELCVVPSTVVNSVILQSSEICNSDQLNDNGVNMTYAQCRSRRGGFITRSAVPSAATDGLALLNPGWINLGNVIQYAADATLLLLNETVTMVEGLITQGQMSTASHLGLAEDSTLLKALKDAGLIGARSWGLNSGSQSVLFPRDGSLVLGGYDEASPAGPFFEYDVAVPDLLNNRHCGLQVVVTQLTLNINGLNQSGSYDLIDKSNKLSVCVEPYDNQFRLPQAILGQFQQYFMQYTKYSGSPVPQSDYGPLLNLEPGIVYPSSSRDFNATLRFTINNELTVDIPHYELERPLRVLDTNGEPVLDTNYNELQIFAMPPSGDAPVVGKAFLSQLYLFVDYEQMKFSLALQNLETSMPFPVSSASCPAAPKFDSTTKGLIGVGVALGVLILVLSLYTLYRWHWKRKGAHQGLQDILMNTRSRSSKDGVEPIIPAQQHQSVLNRPDLDDIRPEGPAKVSSLPLLDSERPLSPPGKRVTHKTLA